MLLRGISDSTLGDGIAHRLRVLVHVGDVPAEAILRVLAIGEKDHEALDIGRRGGLAEGRAVGQHFETH